MGYRMSPLHAILTGDLIGSTSAGPEALAQSMAALEQAAAEIALWPGGTDTRFTRSRGDGWQMALWGPGPGLRVAFVLQARLRALPQGLPTRLSLAVGRVDTLGSRDLSDAAGPAFTASGQGLDGMDRSHRLALALGRQTPFAQALAGLCDAVMRGWSREQAAALALALAPDRPGLAQIAERFGISKQAVNYRLTGAGIAPIRQALADWEDSFARHLIAGVAP